MYLRPFLGLALLLSALLPGCTDDDDDNGSNPASNRIFVQFVANGDTIRFEDGKEGYGNGPGFNSYDDANGRLHNQFTTFGRSAEDPEYQKSILSIQMVRYFEYDTMPVYSTEFGMFGVGNHPYGSFNEDSTNVGVSGVVIAYTDAEGKEWSSDLLFGSQQSGAMFEVTEHQAVDEELFGALTRGVFSCHVHDGQGASVYLTAGSFHARTIFKRD